MSISDAMEPEGKNAKLVLIKRIEKWKSYDCVSVVVAF